MLLSGDTDPVTLTVAGYSDKASPDVIVVAGTTLIRGSPPLTVSGTRYTLAHPLSWEVHL